MAEFGFCNMTYGAQSARHEWRESQARKPERREETAAEAAAAERARAEAEAKRRAAEEEERKRKEEEDRKKREEEEERNKPWWARYEHMQGKVYRRVHSLCCGQRARFHSDSTVMFHRPNLPLQPLLMTIVCILPGALFGTAANCNCEQIPEDHQRDEMSS